ncbi:hypothetical protein F4680DRAFT_398162 [Xylaria scruposa]|nr:hypothetical protein F4680DRAFT_398162 [Xylaria scruposa]
MSRSLMAYKKQRRIPLLVVRRVNTTSFTQQHRMLRDLSSACHITTISRHVPAAIILDEPKAFKLNSNVFSHQLATHLPSSSRPMSEDKGKMTVLLLIGLAVLIAVLSLIVKIIDLTNRCVRRRQRVLQRQEWALHRGERDPPTRRARIRVPRSIPAALKELYTVAERRHQDEYQLDRDDTNCPICLSSFGRRSSDTTSRRDSQVDLEAGLEPDVASETSSAGGFVWKNRPALQAMDTEILRINRCGHAFHARCLVTWFLQGRADCPMCRGTFYPPPSKTMGQ